MSYEQMASELVRAVRGKRSQAALSRRLRCKSNVVYSWEAGRRFPSASKWLWVCERAGIDVRAALGGFFQQEPAWLTEVDPDSSEGIARLLGDLKGKTRLGEVADKSGLSRFAVARYLKGRAEPKLPDFLRLIEVLSLRLLDFVAVFVDPALLPSVAGRWQQLQAARQAAYELPWSHAVLRVLETAGYRALTRHEPGWIAERLGISGADERACLDALEGAGQIRRSGECYSVLAEGTVDTLRDPEAGQRLKVWWSSVALERLQRRAPGRFSYNLFAVSAADYDRIEALLLASRSSVRQRSPPTLRGKRPSRAS
jgi:DNA-binding phage protein